MHPYLQTLISCIDLEEKEQANRYRLDQQHTLKSMKAAGLALHPLTVTRKGFGYLDYPEIGFRLPHPAETGLFRDGSAIECFIAGEEPVKGTMLSIDGKTGEFRLFAPDFPEWIEDAGVGIKLAPDTRTTSIMKKVLNEVENDKVQLALFDRLHGDSPILSSKSTIPDTLQFADQTLNESQRSAVAAALQNESMTIIHGPPGTGKTTTITEVIEQFIKAGEKVLVSAPSHTAVDNLCKHLLSRGVKLLRVGNAGKVDDAILEHTPEGKLEGSREWKDIKNLRKRAEEFRRMAMKYKRNFGKEEREQRNLLMKEVKSIRSEIKKTQTYIEEKWMSEADVIAGTPIGLHDAGVDHLRFKSLVIDEAGQCLEPLAWCLFPLADKVVLAGDHFQLPPVVLSQEAIKLGFNRSILEVALEKVPVVHLLNVQYRMRPSIAGFSSGYFYKKMLQTASYLVNEGHHITFIDTAGSGYAETHGPDGTSLQNEGELQLVRKLIENEITDLTGTAFISPYAGQVSAAKEILPAGIRISTIDSFQGQEEKTVIVSLVRSNEEGEIGFLKDHRRMNVAITRAKENLFIIGDSATIGSDPFFSALLSYVEQEGAYRTVWEFGVEI